MNNILTTIETKSKHDLDHEIKIISDSWSPYLHYSLDRIELLAAQRSTRPYSGGGIALQ